MPQTGKNSTNRNQEILDYIESSNGVTSGEISEDLKISITSAYVGVEFLLGNDCISEGVVKIRGTKEHSKEIIEKKGYYLN